MKQGLFKQSMIYLALSILIVVFSQYVGLAIAYINDIYNALNLFLMPIFSISKVGIFIRNVLILVLMPLLLVGIPAIIYRFIKKKEMPYFFEATWLLWLIITLSNLLIR